MKNSKFVTRNKSTIEIDQCFKPGRLGLDYQLGVLRYLIKQHPNIFESSLQQINQNEMERLELRGKSNLGFYEGYLGFTCKCQIFP
jgi:hypothetical protein